ncbi:MAG: hypothetical protein LW697_09925 [Blastopirellula sp.]|nr:hypothetical protein [Blastopirellula sp.]
MKPHLTLSPATPQNENAGATMLMPYKILAPQANRNPPQAKVAVGAEANVCRQPQVTVHKQGEEVTAFVIICSCGERITLELKY